MVQPKDATVRDKHVLCWFSESSLIFLKEAFDSKELVHLFSCSCSLGVYIGPFHAMGSAEKIGNACQLHLRKRILGNIEFGEYR